MEWKGAQMALTMKEREDVQVQIMGEHINSSYSDFAPFPLGDTSLYFSSMLANDGLAEELYIGHRSQLMRSRDGTAADLYKLFNDKNYHIANITFSPLGQEAYFTKCKNQKGEMVCQIYSSQYRNDLWSIPQLMDQRFIRSIKQPPPTVGSSIGLEFVARASCLERGLRTPVQAPR